MIEAPTLYCSFCGKSQHEVRQLVAGPSAYICDECIELARDVVGEARMKSTRPVTGSADAMPAAEAITPTLMAQED